jgi:hypothetical protein
MFLDTGSCRENEWPDWPKSTAVTGVVGCDRGIVRRPDRKSIAINPAIDNSHFLLGVIQLLSGHNDEALTEFAAENKPLNRDAGSALANFALGNRSESYAALTRLIRDGTQVWPYGIATVFAFRGEKDDAFEWLEKAYTARDYDLQQFVRGDPVLMPLDGDIRWAGRLKRMHLPD